MELQLGLKLEEDKTTATRVKAAAKKKEVATRQISWREVWETGYETTTGKHKAGIFQTKITDSDRRKLLEVKHAIEAGEIGSHVEDLKKFSKSHALNLYKMLAEQRKDATIEKMVKEKPDNYHLITTYTEFTDLIELLQHEELIGLDTETTGVGYFHDDFIVGVSMSLPKADYHCYIPVRHRVEDKQLYSKVVFDGLKPFLESEQLGKVLHNAKFDCHMFLREGVVVRGVAMDTQIAMHVLSENEMSYALKNLATKYGKSFGFEDRSATYEELFGKGGFQNTPLDIATVYACKDTHLCLKFREWILSHMEKQPKLYDVYHKEENEVLKVSIAMEQNGFEIDLDFAEHYKKELAEEVAALEVKIHEDFEGINVDSPAQLAAKIYDDWKISDQQGRSVDKKVLKSILEQYADEQPKVKSIETLLEYRALSKLLSTYIEPLPQKIGRDGRLHGQFNQSKTVTGRYASKEPNLQNLPVGARKMIVAPEGKLILGIDFS